MADDAWFERLADMTGDPAPERAPARMKSKIYSALLARMAAAGPLLDLAVTKTAGGRLCVFEYTLTMLPARTQAGSMNPCRVCHARILAERMEKAPIFWPGCPYSEFHRG